MDSIATFRPAFGYTLGIDLSCTLHNSSDGRASVYGKYERQPGSSFSNPEERVGSFSHGLGDSSRHWLCLKDGLNF